MKQVKPESIINEELNIWKQAFPKNKKLLEDFSRKLKFEMSYRCRDNKELEKRYKNLCKLWMKKCEDSKKKLLKDKKAELIRRLKEMLTDIPEERVKDIMEQIEEILK